MHCNLRLTFRENELHSIVETPVLLMSRMTVEHNYLEFRREFANAHIYYALKANSDIGVVKMLGDLGCGFEVSSLGELELLRQMGIPPQNIITSNPLKSPEFIKSAYSDGIDLFVCDSHTEIEKLAQFAPASQVCVRLVVSNEGSEWPLSNKFGVEPDEAVALLKHAKAVGLYPKGIAFHVGSQCNCPNTWTEAIRKSSNVWELARADGIMLDTLNIGGGFPVEYTKKVPSVREIGSIIWESIGIFFPEGVNVVVEPGRAIVGDAGVIASTVIAKAIRNGQRWLYLDVGVFNGLMETIGGISYPLFTEKNGSYSECVVAGPSCDSFDVIFRNIDLPELEVGDKVYIGTAGAYTISYVSQFNGFSGPKVSLA